MGMAVLGPMILCAIIVCIALQARRQHPPGPRIESLGLGRGTNAYPERRNDPAYAQSAQRAADSKDAAQTLTPKQAVVVVKSSTKGSKNLSKGSSSVMLRGISDVNVTAVDSV
jgi:hypothetical protein